MANAPAVGSYGFVSRPKPQPSIDGQNLERQFRAGRYGEGYSLSLVSKSHLLADEGSYFVWSNPTAGTGITGQANTQSVPAIGSNDTKPYICIQNVDAPGGKRVYLDYIRFRTTVAGTNGTNINFVTILDVPNAPRAVSGGSTLAATNPNMDDASQSICKVSAGNLTVVTTSSGRLLPNVQLRPVITVVSDYYIITFGPTEYTVGSLISSGTGICQQTFGHCPIIIGPGAYCLFYLWMAGQTVGSAFEFDFGQWER